MSSTPLVYEKHNTGITIISTNDYPLNRVTLDTGELKECVEY
jgi:hypothetical protein